MMSAATGGQLPGVSQHLQGSSNSDGGQFLKGPPKNIWNVSEPGILAILSIVRVSREARFVSSVSLQDGPIPIRWDLRGELSHET